MPKNNPKKDVSPSNKKHASSPKVSGLGGGGGQGSATAEVILLSLVNVNEAVLPSLISGEKVIIKHEVNAIQIVTSLGSFIGNVSNEDFTKLQGRRLKSACIFQVQFETKQCIIEAIL